MGIAGILVMGAALMFFACDEPAGKAGVEKGRPPSGAIAEVDGSDNTKKEGKKPQAGTERRPRKRRPCPAGSDRAET